MRLISQDGKIDVPYDKVVIKATEHPYKMVISALFEREDYMKDIVMGYYSTEAKAIKAMEMLREQYMKLGMIKILASGTCEYMDKSLGKEEKMEIYADYCRKHCFKFPADEDVEV